MAARKKHPVLYEVYHRRRRRADQGWKTRPGRWSEQSAGGEMEAETPAGPEATSGPGPAAPEEHWQVTISGPTLAVLAATLVVVLVVTFSAGRHYGSLRPGSTAGEQLELRAKAPAETSAPDNALTAVQDSTTELIGAESAGGPGAVGRSPDGARGVASEPAETETPRVALRKGCHYVIIQHFPKKRGRESALEAARYLRANGVPCALLSGADIRLVATEAFLIKQQDAAAAQQERQRAGQLMRRIKQLGQQFSKELAKQGRRGYTFGDCYVFEIR